MRRPSNYQTKQGEAILSYIASLGEEHVTVEQIAKHFKEQNIPIGLTTVYRNLDKFCAGGKIRKYLINGISGACYRYVREPSATSGHFYLKCENCGELFHLQCELLEELGAHVAEKHVFRIHPSKTVLYGVCKNCLKEA